jgi:hypothetical protein
MERGGPILSETQTELNKDTRDMKVPPYNITHAYTNNMQTFKYIILSINAYVHGTSWSHVSQLLSNGHMALLIGNRIASLHWSGPPYWLLADTAEPRSLSDHYKRIQSRG